MQSAAFFKTNRSSILPRFKYDEKKIVITLGIAGGSGGAAPRNGREVWERKTKNTTHSQITQIFRNNLDDSCVNLAQIQETPFLD